MEFRIFKDFFWLCVFVSVTGFVCGIEPDVVALAQKWAPRIHFNSKEEFWSGDVEEFLGQVSPQGEGCPGGRLPTGPPSQPCFLTTNGKPDDLLKNKTSFLYGTRPPKLVPAYAMVKTCTPDHLVVTYWLFFPFNKGKDMCGLVKDIPLVGHLVDCGKRMVVGNHVGDWEHLSVEFEGGQPVAMFLSVHEGGIYYDWDPVTRTFKLGSQAKEGILKVPHPPQTVALTEDGHPELYCALGSHAVWAAAGTFAYTRLEIHELVDVTDYGPSWDTWKALKVFYLKETTPSWWTFEGSWGNKGSDCILDKYCAFSDGPRGLSVRGEDFKCQA